MNKPEQSKNIPANEPLHELELKANLNPEQRAHLDVLKDKMKKILGGKTKYELAKAADLAALKKYKAILGEILQFLKTKKIKDNRTLSFKTIEELEAFYSPEQIAHSKEEVGKDTMVYIGQLYPGIFNELPKDVEHIYTSFPEDKVVQKEITIGGKTAKELEKELEEKGYIMRGWAKEMMESDAFNPAKKAEKLNLVFLSVAALGFTRGATRQQIYERALELGLEIVPAEVGPQLRLQYKDQPRGDYLEVGSEPLTNASGHLGVFGVYRNDNGQWIENIPGELDKSPGAPDFNWAGHDRWAFARPS